MKNCQCCNKKHTSICKKDLDMLLTINTTHMTYPVILIDVGGVNCRLFIDTWPGSSCVSSKLISRLNKKPTPGQSETPMHLLVQKTAIYELQISGINHEFVNQSCKRGTIRDT